LLELTKVFSTFRKTRFDLTESKTKKIDFPSGQYKFALIESYRINDYDSYVENMKAIIKEGFHIIFTTPRIPNKPFIDKNITYVIAPPKYMGMLTFNRESFSKISFVFGLDEGGSIEADRISKKYHIEKIDSIKRLPRGKFCNIISDEESKLNILFDTNYEASGRGLGDILMTTAIIKQIKKDYPNSFLTFSTRPEGKEILKNNPHIDSINTDIYNKTEFEKSLVNYDKHFFLGKMTEDYDVKRNQQPRIDSMAEMFDVNLDSKLPEIYLTNEELISTNEYIDIDKINIVICVEGQEKKRNWRIDYLRDFVKRFDSDKYRLILVGKKEIDVDGCVNLSGKTTIRELFSIVSKADLVITMDNFVSHIAAAFNVREIIMYTTIPSDWRCRYYKNAIPIQSPTKCSPCWNKYKNKDRMCNNEGKCIDNLTVDLLEKYVKRNASKKKRDITSFFRRETETPTKTIVLGNSKVICVSLWRRLGDCLFAIPTVKQLKKIYIDYKIIWLTHYKYYDIVKNLPYIDGYVLFQGKVDDGWDAYLPNPERQIMNFIDKIKPEKFYDLHISPKYSNDLSRKKYSIVEYVGYELAKINELDTKLEYHPDISIKNKVKKDFDKFRKDYKGIITYNSNCFSVSVEKLFSRYEIEEVLKMFERDGYRVINLGHILDNTDSNRTNYRNCSLDFIYYGVKYSDLFIGFDSGVRNLALTVPNSKVISLDNEQSIKNKSSVELVSKDYNHISVNIENETPYHIYLKGKSLLTNNEIAIKEFEDIIKYQFVRRKEAISRKIQEHERGLESKEGE
jgi:ADP-heptose:LPS heptosyltransferase